MSTFFLLSIAILLPWLVGSLWVCLISRFGDDRLSLLSWASYGYLFGFLLLTLLLRWLPVGAYGASSLLLLQVVILLYAIARTNNAYPLRFSLPKINFDQRFYLILIVALLCTIHLWFLALDNVTRPLFAWDSWSTWAVKSRLWFELGHYVPFVDSASWLAAEQHQAGVFTLAAWHYPDAVPLIQTWVASVLGHWDDALINLPWVFCYIAIVAAFTSHVATLKIPYVVKLVGVYFLATLPMLNAHIAVAGYADIWLTAAFLLTTLSLLQFLLNGSQTQLILAVISALCAVMIKKEGVVLIGTLLPLVVCMRCHQQRINTVLWGGLLGVAMMLLLIINLGPIDLELPYLGAFRIAYHPVWDSVWINYFQFPNWQLMLYLIGAGFCYALWSQIRQPQQQSVRLKLIMLLPITLFGYLFCVFFLTQNYAWAEYYSSINRISLHFIPTVFFCLLLSFDQRLKNSHLLREAS